MVLGCASISWLEEIYAVPATKYKGNLRIDGRPLKHYRIIPRVYFFRRLAEREASLLGRYFVLLRRNYKGNMYLFAVLLRNPTQYEKYRVRLPPGVARLPTRNRHTILFLGYKTPMMHVRGFFFRRLRYRGSSEGGIALDTRVVAVDRRSALLFKKLLEKYGVPPGSLRRTAGSLVEA